MDSTYDLCQLKEEGKNATQEFNKGGAIKKCFTKGKCMHKGMQICKEEILFPLLIKLNIHIFLCSLQTCQYVL